MFRPAQPYSVRQVGAEEAQRADAPRQLDGKGAVAEVLGDHRQVFLLDELPRRVARQLLLAVEQLVEL